MGLPGVLLGLALLMWQAFRGESVLLLVGFVGSRTVRLHRDKARGRETCAMSGLMQP